MGNGASFPQDYQYAVPVSDPTPGSSHVYRAASHPSELITGMIDRTMNSAWDLFKGTVTRQPHRPFLGRRFRRPSNELGPYEWMSYAEAENIALCFGTTLIRNDLVPSVSYPEELLPAAQRMRILGLYAKNCVEWFLAEQACNAFDITLCPLYDTLGDDSMEYILEQTKMVTILVAFDCFPTLLRVIATKREDGSRVRKPHLTSVQTIILIDPSTDDSRQMQQKFREASEMGKEVGLDVMIWHEVVAAGIDSLPAAPATNRDAINTLCYTSGTTGQPKGVLISNLTVLSVVCGAVRGPIAPHGIFDVNAGDCIISYLPLAHVFERCVCNIVITVGGSIGLYSGDMAKLLDDIKVLKPSVFLSVPRLFNRINDRIALTLQEKKAPMQMLFNQGLNAKVNRRRNESTTTHRLWDAVVFAKIRSMMGGRLRGMICGGAPLDPAVCERMSAFFAAPLMQGYGLSESFGPCFLMHPLDSMAGPVGGVWPGVEYKLCSVPELNYLVTDKPPRGELCLRGPGVASGYFMNPEGTAAAWDDENWFHTGDIVVLIERTRAVQIIDRKKNIFKLSQGEYVAPEKIEAIYGQAVLVGQIFVFGYSHKTCLVGVVVPDEEAAAKWAEKNNADPKLESICRNLAFKSALKAEMETVGVKNGLKGFEKVRDFHMTPVPFTVENDLMTPTQKIRRAEAKKAFEAEIDALYDKPQNH